MYFFVYTMHLLLHCLHLFQRHVSWLLFILCIIDISLIIIKYLSLYISSSCINQSINQIFTILLIYLFKCVPVVLNMCCVFSSSSSFLWPWKITEKKIPDYQVKVLMKWWMYVCRRLYLRELFPYYISTFFAFSVY